MKLVAILSSASCALAAISGDLTVSYGDEKVKIKGDLAGLPLNVAKGGIHVHTGTNCSDASTVGGHLMSGHIDGWLKTKYSTDADGSTTVNLALTGYTLENVTGRCVVMHGVSSDVDKLSAHAARGQIVKSSGSNTYIANIAKHSGSTLATNPQGTLAIKMDSGTMKISGKLTGLAKNLAGAGIHVHSKRSTCVTGDVGGHLFGDGDTWLDTKYDSNAKGEGTINIATATGSHTLKKNDHSTKKPAVENHCVVIHGTDGSKIGIGKIICAAGSATCTASMGDFPGMGMGSSSSGAWRAESILSVSACFIMRMIFHSLAL